MGPMATAASKPAPNGITNWPARLAMMRIELAVPCAPAVVMSTTMVMLSVDASPNENPITAIAACMAGSGSGAAMAAYATAQAIVLPIIRGQRPIAMTIRLYGSWLSPFARKAALALELKALPYDYVDGLLAENRAELHTLNPRGEVPVLVDDGVTVINSSDIVQYLEWRYGFAPLGYRAIAAGRDPAEGIAVFRLRRRGRAAEAALCEVVVPHGAARTARHLGRAVARATGADYVVRLGRATPAGGYLPLPNQGPILTWRALATAATEPPPLDGWELSLGDVELL